MKWFEVVASRCDGDTIVRRFRTEEEAHEYVEQNDEWDYYGYEPVDTDSPYFFD